MTGTATAAICSLLERIPQWVRDDFARKDPTTRQRTEETLAAMLVIALEQSTLDKMTHAERPKNI